jgi:hypothetical protein
VKVVERPHGLALAHTGQIVDGRDDVAGGLLQIGLQVAPSYDAFLGVEVDQDHRPLIKEAHTGDHRTLEGNQHWPDVD